METVFLVWSCVGGADDYRFGLDGVFDTQEQAIQTAQDLYVTHRGKIDVRVKAHPINHLKDIARCLTLYERNSFPLE